jgi:hypothetical protein
MAGMNSLLKLDELGLHAFACSIGSDGIEGMTTGEPLAPSPLAQPGERACPRLDRGVGVRGSL